MIGNDRQGSGVAAVMTGLARTCRLTGEAGARAQDHITAALFFAVPDNAQPSAGWRSGPGP